MNATPEQELRWAEQDYRIAVDNLAAAERQLEDATDAFNDAMETLTKARHAMRGRTARAAAEREVHTPKGPCGCRSGEPVTLEGT